MLIVGETEIEQVEEEVFSENENEDKDKYDIEEVFGEDPLRKKYKEALKDEKLLWHNNIDLPYEKKINRE